MVEADIKLTAGDMYDYNLRHTYSQPVTILATFIGIIGIVVAICYRDRLSAWPMMIVIGALLVVYTPVTLFMRSKQHFLLNPSMKQPFHYLLDDNGITISQGEASETHGWDSVVKAVSTGRSIIVYTSRTTATIIPKKQAGDSLSLFVQTIAKNIDPKKNKIRS